MLRRLTEFVINRGNRVVEECISTAWEMEKAGEVLQRSKQDFRSWKIVCKTLAPLSVTAGGRYALNSYLHGTTCQLRFLLKL